jgi:putative Holliday junction resolvase
VIDGGDGIPREGRLLGIDYGSVRLGLAVSDPSQRIASPYENYTRRSPTRDAKYLVDVVREERIVGVIVGLPLHLDGQESPKSKETRQFTAWLAKQLVLPMSFFDERFTSVEAARYLSASGLSRQKRKQRLDMLAAQLLLTGYLESDRSRSERDFGGLDDADVRQIDPSD